MNSSPNCISQRGVVLVMCLIFMLFMSVLAGSALQSTTLQERMAGHTRDGNSAFQAAEAALREAERVLQGVSVGPFNGGRGLYQDCDGPGAECKPPSWSDRNSSGWVNLAGFGGGVSASPQYYIEALPNVRKTSVSLDADIPPAPLVIYRVTARGFGVSNKSMAVLRSIYRRE